MKTAGGSEPICFFDIEKTALICYHLLDIRRGGGKVKKKSNNAVIQYLKFIVVGSINAIVNYVAYTAVVLSGVTMCLRLLWASCSVCSRHI